VAPRVVITGLGVASPLGLGVDAFWTALGESRAAAETFEQGPLALIPPAAGGRTPVPMKLAREFFDPRELRNATMHGSTLMAVVATGDCLARAGLEGDTAAGARYGCYVGTEIAYPDHRKQARGAITLVQRDGTSPDGWRFNDDRLGDAMKPLSAFDFLRTLPNMAGSHVSIRGRFRGPISTYLGSWASGVQAIVEAWREIRAGVADGMLAAGAWHPFGEMYLGYLRRRGFSVDHAADPAIATRPFDRGRRGFVPAEAGAAFLLERLDVARARGATILAEVVGGATRFAVPGSDADDAREATLAAALPADLPVDALALTGAGHPELDRLEGQAWTARLGAKRAGAIPWITPSANTGFTGSAAAPLATVAALLAMESGQLPPAINLEQPDPTCGPVPSRPAAIPVDIGGIGVSAFSPEGTHAALALRRWRGSSA
jgi:3-oxoacyl-[acyl-carrier-protein] synthase II